MKTLSTSHSLTSLCGTAVGLIEAPDLPEDSSCRLHVLLRSHHLSLIRLTDGDESTIAEINASRAARLVADLPGECLSCDGLSTRSGHCSRIAVPLALIMAALGGGRREPQRMERKLQ